MNGEIFVVDNVAEAFANHVRDAFDARENQDAFSIAFSGGSTARPCYEQLVETNIDWSLVTAIWGDERLVPLDHQDSNYRLARESLFDRVLPLAATHPMTTDIGAKGYEDIVAELLPIDVIHLGMGDDGHTASLFPGSPALQSPPERLVVETEDEFHKHPRMTLTFSAIAQSRLAIFTVQGSNKREMFKRIRNGEHLPAAQIAAHRVIWLVDKEAA
jgi:6-phosphogluconolactonase